MKRVFPQESAADSHSLTSNEIQPGALGGSRRVHTSAAMLGIALSFGTSAPLLLEPESALAVEGPVVAVLPTAGSQAEMTQPVIVDGPSSLTSTAYHTVEEGDSLWHIAKEHQADVQTIKAANGIEPDEVLHVGQVLRVPSVIEGIQGSEQADKVQRLALRDNVRGGVGGDLSVVFGEELPVTETTDDAEDLASSSLVRLDGEKAKKLDTEALTAQEPYEVTAAALSDSSETAISAMADSPSEAEVVSEESVAIAALPEGLPSSMPLNAVEANPLEALNPSEVAPVTVSDDVKVTAEEAVQTTSSANGAQREPTDETNVSTASWHDQDIQTVSQVSTAQAVEKPLTVAALADETSPSEAATDHRMPAAATQVYRVKAGDTFWNIANRHGLSLDQLMRHNAGQSPDNLIVGDSLNIPVDAAQATPEISETTVARASQLQSEPDREAVIQDHLTRIREAANREIDQEELKARIIAVRQSLERAEADAVDGAPLEFHSPQEESVSSLPEQGIGGAVLTEDQPSQEAVARASASSQAGWKVTDAASDDEAVELAALSTAAEVAPESAVAPTVPTNLMAAAPMDPDVYRASPQVPVGETVSPGMPILPESGEYLPEAPNRFNGYVWPAQGTLTSGYGWRWGRMHRGIDIAGPVGTPIMAAASGVVVRSGWNSGGYGNLVDIRHADGSLTRYAHNSRLLVREGQQVRQGQQIAEMGSTGYSTGPHVHFEVHLPNTGTVNPMAHLPGR